MSSGAAEAGEFDLNRYTEAVVDQLGAGSGKGLEDATVSIGGKVIVEEGKENMDVDGDEKKECEREEGSGVADREDELLGNEIVGSGSEHSGEIEENSEMNEMEKENSVCVVESRDGKLLEVGIGEKGSPEQIVVSAEGFESAEVSDQDKGLEVEIADYQKRASDVDAEEDFVTDSISVGSSNLADEHVEAEEDTTDRTHIEGAVSDTMGHDTLVVSEINSKGEDTIDPTHLQDNAGSDTVGHATLVSEIDCKGEDAIVPTHLKGAGSDTMGHDILVVSEIDGQDEGTINSTHLEGVGYDTVEHDTLDVIVTDSKGEDTIDPMHVEGATILVSEIASKCEDIIDPTHVEGAGSDAVGYDSFVVRGAGNDTVGHDTLLVSEIESKCEDTIDPTHVKGSRSDKVGHETFLLSEIDSKCEDTIGPTHIEGAGSDTGGHDTLVVSEINSKGEDTIDPTHLEGAGHDSVGHDTLVVSEIDNKGGDIIDPTHLEGVGRDTMGHDTLVVSEIGSNGEGTIDPTHLEGAGHDATGHDTLVVSEIDSKCEDTIDLIHVEGVGNDTVGHDTLLVSKIDTKCEDTIDPTHVEGAGIDAVGCDTFLLSVTDSKGEDTIDPMHVEGAGSDRMGHDTLLVSEIDSKGEDSIDPMHVAGAGSDTVGHDSLLVSEIDSKCEDTIDPTHVEGAGSDTVGHDTLLVSEIGRKGFDSSDAVGSDQTSVTYVGINGGAEVIDAADQVPEAKSSDRVHVDSKCEDTIDPTHVEGAWSDTVGHDTLLVSEIGSKGFDSSDGVGGDQISVPYVGINGGAEVLDAANQVPEAKSSDSVHVEDKDMSDGAQFIEKAELLQKSVERVNDAVFCDFIAEKNEGAGNDAMPHAAHDDDTGDSMGVERVDFIVGVTGGQSSVSSAEIDAEPDDADVACRNSEAKELKNEPNSEGGEVKIKENSDVPQFMEEAIQTRRTDDILDNIVCDFVAGHLDDRDEVGGEKSLKLAEVSSNIILGKELLIKKGLEEPDFIDRDLGANEPEEISVGNHQKEVVTYENHEDIVLGTAEGSEVDFAGGETNFCHHSVMDSEITEYSTQAFSVEMDQKVCEEDINVACETVHRVDTIAIAKEYDPGLEEMEVVCEKIEGNPVADDGDKEVEMDSKFIAGSELLLEKGMETVSTAIEHSLVEGEPGNNELGLFSDSNLLKTKIVTSEKQDDICSGTSQGSEPVENQTVLSQGTEAECQDIQPPHVSSMEHELMKRLEAERGTSASGYIEDIGFQSQKSGKDEAFDESDQQIQEQNSSRENSASTSQQATYSLSFEKNEGFSISDLVWGKVKSHPWWPGQIIDFSDASELAFKYQKKDNFLVAYFGDKTFAWCEESNLKPFQLYFSQMEKQCSSDSFSRGMGDILAEVSRRIELGMACLCIPEATYADIKYQKIENAGIRGKTISSAVDGYQVVNCFQPEKLIEYITALAQIPTGGADRLELAVALAQFKAFYRSKGFTELPTFIVGSGLVENDFEVPSSVVKTLEKDDLEQSATLSDLFSAKGKSRGRDGLLNKEKLITDNGRKQQADEDLTTSGKKRKDLESDFTDIGRSKTKKLDSLADKETKVPTPTSNISFKVGEFISRAASKLTSGQLSRKCHLDSSEKHLSKIDDRGMHDMDIDDFLDTPFDSPKAQVDISQDSSSMNEMLSKLYLAAREPMKGYDSFSMINSFFTAFRNSCVSNATIENSNPEKPRAKRGRKKKINPDSASPDMSTPDHMKDSYWSDMIFPENDSVTIPKRRGRKRKKPSAELSPSHMLNPPSDVEIKLHMGAMCPHVKHILAAERPIISVEEKIVDERTPTAVILYFNNPNSLPSETDLIRIFSRYGPLKEADTYIEMKTNSAKVVFKKRADAEMAFSSAGKFSNFGPSLLSYRLRYLPSKSSPENTVEGENNDASIRSTRLGISADSRTGAASDDKPSESLGEDTSNIENASDMPSGEGAAKESSDFFLIERKTGILSDRTQVDDMGQECFKSCLDEDVAGMGLNPAECVDKGSDYFVQAQETSVVSEQMLLESEDQELSYFDLDHSEAGAVSENVHVETINQDSSFYLLDKVENVKAADAKESFNSAAEEVKASDNMQVETVNQDSSGCLLDMAETGELAHAIEFESCGKKLFDPAAEEVKASDNMQVETVNPDSSGYLLDMAETEELAHGGEFESDGQESFDPAAEVKAVTSFESSREVSSSTPGAEANNLRVQVDNAIDQPGSNECSDSAPAHAGTGTSEVEDICQDVSNVDTDEKSVDNKFSNFVQDNIDAGKNSGAGAVQTAEELSVSVAFGEEMNIGSDPVGESNGKFPDSTCVESAEKDSCDLVPSEMGTGLVFDIADVEVKVQESSNFYSEEPKMENTVQVDDIDE